MVDEGLILDTRISSTPRTRNTAWVALLLAVLVLGLLWLVNIPFRRAYQANDNDVTALVDGLLLLPGARWEDWFTQGHSHFFDSYPEWPWGLTPFARPVFQLLIYLAHFVFGRDWPAYLAINYLAIGGVAAVAFAIARSSLRLSVGASVLSAALAIISPAVLDFSIWELGFASESLICILVGCAFLALVSRRDVLCFSLLLIALFTKETAVWAPFAGALTVLLRIGQGESVRRRLLGAVVMLLPLVVWLGFRIVFFGGAGGSYATGGYAQPIVALELVISKLAHLYRLFVSQQVFVAEGVWSGVDRVIMIATYLLVALQILIWALSGAHTAVREIGNAVRVRRWPDLGSAMLVTLWTATGLAFYFVLALSDPRYAASAVMFFWPAAVAQVAKGGVAGLRLGLALCFVLMLGRTSLFLRSLNPPSEQSYIGQFFRSIAAIDAAIREAPAGIRQVYVLSASGLVTATPKHLQAFLEVPVEIVRLVDIHWYCKDGSDFVAFDREIAAGVVTLKIALPPSCANFFFDMAGPASASLIDGQLRRSDSITYELPEAYRIDHKGPVSPALEPGRRMVVHVRPSGPARFIVQRPEGVTWFDIP